MLKYIIVYAFFIFSFAVTAYPLPVFTGHENSLKVTPADNNYYLATLIGESECYDPTFYDDYILSISKKPVVHFTKIKDTVIDFYFYITDPEDQKFISPS